MTYDTKLFFSAPRDDGRLRSPLRRIFSLAHAGSAAEGRIPVISRAGFQLPGGLAFAMLPPMLWKEQSIVTTSVSNVAATSIGIFVAIVIGFYALRQISSFPTIKEIGSVLPVFTVSFLTVIAGFFLLRLEYSRFQFVGAYLLALIWFVAVSALNQSLNRKRFLVVPTGEALSVCRLSQADWLVAEGSDEAPPKSCAGVVIDLRAEIPPHWQRFLTACVLAGTPVYHFKQVREFLTGRLEIEHLSENILGSHNPHDGYLQFKSVIDKLAAVIAAITLCPCLLVVAALIRLDSKGPALFRQARVKRGGSVFTIYKFRTMYVEIAPETTSREDAITRDGDRRITRIGAFLRRSRIDELPQIINILKGEMSWIGPRPEAVPLAQWYGQRLPFYHYRHIVPPGVTGWAQVNQGHVTDPEDVLEKLHYDFFYIKNFSIWLDILILLKTLRTMATGFGAR